MQRSILIPVDFSEESERVFFFAADLACRFAATIKLIHVLPKVPDLADKASVTLSGYDSAVLEQAEVELQRLAELDVFEDVQVETDVSLEDSPASGVARAVELENTCMVVVSGRGRRGPARLLLGSVTEEIVRSCPAPVLTVHENDSVWRDGQTVLVAVDFSPASVVAVEAAARLSRLLSLEVHLVHVLENPDSPSLAEALPEGVSPPQEDLRASVMEKLSELAVSAGLGDRFQVATVFGDAKDRVLDLAKALEPGLIVVGSHGRKGLGRVVLGSVAEGIVRESTQPALVVKDGGFVEHWPANVPARSRGPEEDSA